MATPIYEVLLDTVKELCQIKDTSERMNALAKFMLSGKVQLEVALKYFSKADRILFKYNSFEVLGKTWSLDPALLPLPPILKRLSESVDKLEIWDQFEQLEVLDQFITRGIKSVCVESYTPQCFHHFDHKLEEIVGISEIEFGGPQSYISELFSIPSKKHVVRLSGSEVLDIAGHRYGGLSDYVSMEVESLIMSQSSDSEIRQEDVKRLIHLLNECLPNLKQIDATLRYGRDDYDPVLINLLLPHHTVFQQIRSDVKGTITFSSSWNCISELRDCPDLVYDEESRIATKCFDVHDGLIVRILINGPYLPPRGGYAAARSGHAVGGGGSGFNQD